MVPLIATAKHGRPNAVIRIVEWSVTVPFLLSLVGAYGETRRQSLVGE